jgi:hypothetical protein
MTTRLRLDRSFRLPGMAAARTNVSSVRTDDVAVPFTVSVPRPFNMCVRVQPALLGAHAVRYE